MVYVIWLSSVLYTELISASLTNFNLLLHSLILFYFYLDRKKEKKLSNCQSHKKVKMWFHKQFSLPCRLFCLHFNHGKEEQVLVQIGAQYKCIGRPVRPVFPVSCFQIIFPFFVTMIKQSQEDNRPTSQKSRIYLI